MNPALRSHPDGSLPALDGPIDAVFLGDVVTEDRVIEAARRLERALRGA